MNGGPGSGPRKGAGKANESTGWITGQQGKAVAGKAYDEGLSKKGFKGIKEFKKVDSKTAARLKKATGKDLSKHAHGLDESSVRHMQGQHGDSKKEAARGQVAITKKDFQSLPGMVSDPKTKISKDRPTKQGLETIRYERTRKNLTVLIEEIRKQHLVPKTLYVKKQKNRVAASSASRLTGSPSESSKTFRNSIQNIAQGRASLQALCTALKTHRETA